MICYSLYKSLLVKIRRIFKKEESFVKTKYVPLPSENVEGS